MGLCAQKNGEEMANKGKPRRLVSSTRYVKQELVGTTKPLGSDSDGDNRVYAGTVMSTWNCGNCGHQNIGGDTKHCPNCQSPKGDYDGEEYQQPALDAPYLSAAKLNDMNVDITHHYSDEQCPFCNSRLKPQTKVCPNCHGVVRPDEEDEPEPSFEQVSLYQNQADLPEVSKSGFTVNWKLIGIGLIVAALIGLVTFFLWPREEQAVVTQASWVSTVSLQEYQYNQYVGWEIPIGGDYVSESREIHHYDPVYVRTDTECHRERVDDPDTCRSVYSHTDRDCYDDGTCDEHDVYEQECTENYHYENVCEETDVYRQEPRYAQKYTYNIWEWVEISPVTLSGTGSDIRYPTDFVIDDYHRESGREQTFALVFTVGEDSYTYVPQSLDEYLRYPEGSEWIIVRNWSIITEIKPLPAR